MTSDKSTIYNAISSGIINALTIDDESSISYQKSSIDSVYQQDISLDELFDVFNNKSSDIFKYHYNTKNSVSFILKNGAEISLSEYNYRMFFNLEFLKISNPELKSSGNEILIHIIDHCISQPIAWQNETHQIQPDEYLIKYHAADNYYEKLENDFSGYENTQRIINFAKQSNEYVPAFKYCNSLIINGYQGYLPAPGQLLLIAKYLKMINYIFKRLKISQLDMNNYCYWTSTESNNSIAWYVGADNNQLAGYSKYPKAYRANKTQHNDFFNFVALPLFKK